MDKEERINALLKLKENINLFVTKNKETHYKFDYFYIEQSEVMLKLNKKLSLITKIKNIYNNETLISIIQAFSNSYNLIDFSKINICLNAVITAIQNDVCEEDFNLFDYLSNLEKLELLKAITYFIESRIKHLEEISLVRNNYEAQLDLIIDSFEKSYIGINKTKSNQLYYIYDNSCFVEVVIPISTYCYNPNILNDVKNKTKEELEKSIFYKEYVNYKNKRVATQEELSNYTKFIKEEINKLKFQEKVLQDSISCNKDLYIVPISNILTSLKFQNNEYLIQILEEKFFNNYFFQFKKEWAKFNEMLNCLITFYKLDENSDIDEAISYYCRKHYNNFFDLYVKKGK